MSLPKNRSSVVIRSLRHSVLQDDQDLKEKLTAIWDRHEKGYEHLKGEFIVHYLACDCRQDKAAELTERFGKVSSKLLAGALQEMRECLADAIHSRMTNLYIREMMKEIVFNNHSRFDTSSEDE